MEQTQSIAPERKGKHLTREERVVIERMLAGGYLPASIAKTLGRHQRTIEREMARGRVEHIDSELRVKTVYSSDRGQDLHDLNATAKGPELKLGANRNLVEFVRDRIREHHESPDVVAFRMREAGLETTVCTKTLYNYIDQGLIDGVSNETLWEKRKRRKHARRTVRRIPKRAQKRESIEQRPPHVEDREEFGHWEIDLVVGPAKGSNAALLTLVERKTRHLICRKLPDKSQDSVIRALKAIEKDCGTKEFRKRFKSITADNGSEFLDVRRLQSSAFSRRQRTVLFYAHPYASWERGSNENANRMIRRFIAKGRDIAAMTHQAIKQIVEWINNYPRKLLDYQSPQQCFQAHIQATSA